jgi:hypothetical protein
MDSPRDQNKQQCLTSPPTVCSSATAIIGMTWYISNSQCNGYILLSLQKGFLLHQAARKMLAQTATLSTFHINTRILNHRHTLGMKTQETLIRGLHIQILTVHHNSRISFIFENEHVVDPCRTYRFKHHIVIKTRIAREMRQSRCFGLIVVIFL